MRLIQSKNSHPFPLLHMMSPCRAALPQRSCSKSCLAAAPLRDQVKYRAGVPATELDATSLITLDSESPNRTCPGPEAASCFNFSNTTSNRKEKWANWTQKGAQPMLPHSSSSQKTDAPSGLTEAVQWPTAGQPGPWGLPWGSHTMTVSVSRHR